MTVTVNKETRNLVLSNQPNNFIGTTSSLGLLGNPRSRIVRYIVSRLTSTNALHYWARLQCKRLWLSAVSFNAWNQDSGLQATNNKRIDKTRLVYVSQCTWAAASCGEIIKIRGYLVFQDTIKYVGDQWSW